jgi:hypothetical protein
METNRKEALLPGQIIPQKELPFLMMAHETTLSLTSLCWGVEMKQEAYPLAWQYLGSWHNTLLVACHAGGCQQGHLRQIFLVLAITAFCWLHSQFPSMKYSSTKICRDASGRSNSSKMRIRAQSYCFRISMAAGDVPMAQLPTGWSIAMIATATAAHWQKDHSKFFPFVLGHLLHPASERTPQQTTAALLQITETPKHGSITGHFLLPPPTPSTYGCCTTCEHLCSIAQKPSFPGHYGIALGEGP